MESIEISGLIFTKESDIRYSVLDISYGMKVGTLIFDEGPGWVLTDLPTYLDQSHFLALHTFISSL